MCDSKIEKYLINVNQKGLLNEAIKADDVETLNYFCLFCDVDINQIIEKLNYDLYVCPIHVAIVDNSIKCFEYLLSSKKCNKIINFNCYTILDIAVLYGRFEIVKLILERIKNDELKLKIDRIPYMLMTPTSENFDKIEMIKLFSDCGFELEKDILNKAITYKNQEVIDFLVNEKGMTIPEPTKGL